jgi:hypothetical protein
MEINKMALKWVRREMNQADLEMNEMAVKEDGER